MTISTRLPENIVELRNRIALETDRSRSFHIQNAVRVYLEQFADTQVALDPLRDVDDPIISSEEMKQVLGL